MADVPASLGIQIDDPPTDGISSISFAKTSDALLVTSWDGTVRVYDVDPDGRSTLRCRFDTNAPVLDACFCGENDDAVVSCGLSKAVMYHDLDTQVTSVVGTHSDTVRCVAWDQSSGGLIFSAGWDGQVKCWDLSKPAESRCLRSASLPGKAHAMALYSGTTESNESSGDEIAAPNRLVIATAGGRIVSLFPKRFPESGEIEFDRASTLSHQTRALAITPDGGGFVNTSVEGRVAWERFSGEQVNEQYAFKCHRTKDEGCEKNAKAKESLPHSVHAACFHPTGAFCTGGGDGFVNTWDGNRKKRVFQYERYPTSVAGVSFSKDGTRVAVAVSAERKNETANVSADAVYVKLVGAAQVALKNK